MLYKINTHDTEYHLCVQRMGWMGFLFCFISLVIDVVVIYNGGILM